MQWTRNKDTVGNLDKKEGDRKRAYIAVIYQSNIHNIEFNFNNFMK